MSLSALVGTGEIDARHLPGDEGGQRGRHDPAGRPQLPQHQQQVLAAQVLHGDDGRLRGLAFDHAHVAFFQQGADQEALFCIVFDHQGGGFQ